MSSAALLALQAAINSNALTVAQQAALSSALDTIIPTFPTPGDGGAVTTDNEAALARNWMAPLYAIAAGAPAPPMTATLQTPNTETTFLASEAPGPGGAVLALLDFTPTRTGKMRINVNVSMNVTGGADFPTIALIYIDNLTAVGGGTLIATGITAGPSSVTPPVSGGVSMCAFAEPTFDTDSVAVVVLAGIPLQAVVGHRTGVAVVLASPNSRTFTNVAAVISVDEVGP